VEDGVLVPPYRRIAAEIRARIEAGELRPGDRVPSARVITREWGVAIATATKALGVLKDDGLTVPRPGAGTVVAQDRVVAQNSMLAQNSMVAPNRAVAQTRAPRRERDITRERVVRAAIAIADTHGMAEVSMRRVAAELGVSTMALYRHVPGKTELVQLMIDATIGEQPMPARRPPGWRAQLEVCLRMEWQLFRRHPWLAPSMSLARPDMSPNGARITEWILAALAGSGLSSADKMYANILLFSFVRSVAGALESEVEAVRETGLSTEEWMDSQQAAFTAMFAELPHLRQLATEPFDFDLDFFFEFGLARLLDGIARLIGLPDSDVQAGREGHPGEVGEQERRRR
jgi:AcrR family transcriptional regulator